MRKSKKLPINALLICIDIPVVLLLYTNINNDIISTYISIRVIMFTLITLMLPVKIIKTTITLFIKSKLLTSLLSMATFRVNLSDIQLTLKNMLRIVIFYFECMILLIFFAYSMENTKNIMSTSDNLINFLVIILLNIPLVLIHIYLNKRCMHIMSNYE